MFIHLPVLIREVKEVLAPERGGIYVDATIGLGGHAEEILEMIGKSGKLIGIDRDERALKEAGERLKDTRLILKKGNFTDIKSILYNQRIDRVDGILFDLGLSMMQLRDAKRGFSFYAHEKLDMRMNSAAEFSAWDVINRYPERELVRILKEYGEERRAVAIARSIVRHRKRKTIDTCAELAEIITREIGRRGRIHPATRTFQALRIEVNKELEALRQGLDASVHVLKRGGKLCVISYHSLEDRIVKNFIRDSAKNQMLRPLLKKPLRPSIDEIRMNPSSRSARLRGAEKL